MTSWAKVAACASVTLGATVACSKKAEKPAPAATVKQAVTEGSLTTVVLSPDAVRRLGIETAPVESMSVLPTRTLGGEVIVPPGQSLTVTAPVAGRVLAPDGGGVPAAGTRVQRGQVLMRLIPLPTDVGRAEPNAEVANARLRQAQAEADRVGKLFADGLVSAREQERAQADLASARAEAEAGMTQLRLARGGSAEIKGVTPLRITAPDAGVVQMLHAAPGQAVAAGAPLAQVVPVDRLWVRVPVYAGDARSIARSAPAVIHGLGGPQSGLTVRATPVTAPPSADATAASVDLYYQIPSGGASYRPGERVGVTLTLAGSSTERGLTVPLASLVRDMSGGSWVYERTDSITFVRRRVEVVRVSGAHAVLSIGPKPGVQVVTAGAAELFGTEFGAGK